jgi:hypothetical protein
MSSANLISKVDDCAALSQESSLDSLKSNDSNGLTDSKNEETVGTGWRRSEYLPSDRVSLEEQTSPISLQRFDVSIGETRYLERDLGMKHTILTSLSKLSVSVGKTTHLERHISMTQNIDAQLYHWSYGLDIPGVKPLRKESTFYNLARDLGLSHYVAEKYKSSIILDQDVSQHMLTSPILPFKNRTRGEIRISRSSSGRTSPPPRSRSKFLLS